MQKKLFKRRLVTSNSVEDIVFFAEEAEEILPVGKIGISQWETDDYAAVQLQSEPSAEVLNSFKTLPKGFELP